MRIIGGTARGRRLAVPDGPTVRPTADRVREAVFSSLHAHVPAARVLDLFAGSGALGLEAISRGAAHVTFVERDRRAVAAIRANIDALDVARNATVVVADVLRAVTDGQLDGAPFDLVFADPPYAVDAGTVYALLAGLPPHLADGAQIVLERATAAPGPTWPARMTGVRARRYGATTIHRAYYGAADRGTRREESR
ncbi:MAG: 16S rRNA (guanine(966)-N(2))-methyltransferase RsmD [Nitriliruptoraceae bacterium]